MSEKDSNKGLWGRLTGAGSSQESLHRRKSLDKNFADPSFLSADEPGFPHASPQKIDQPPIPSTGAPFGLSKLFGAGSSNSSSVPGAPATPSPRKVPPALKPIKTPHNEPISHPELAFSPSDIGVWEINKSKKGGGWFS
ncbi:g4016 [Coccomyxa viridis]|uniref:G4016 protein n=1 Tax=Coccomyxa viridis TaxID=1274662 RepID=A0ABP1FP67_9CHLO